MKLLGQRCLLVLLASVLVCASCNENKGSNFNELYRSDMGLNIALDMSVVDVQAVLGSASIRSKIQNGTSITDSYLPEGTEMVTNTTPQLTLTYLDGKLMRIFNSYQPQDPEGKWPPYFAELLPTVRLGCRKSDIVVTLGKPEKSGILEWEFKHRDGREIFVSAHFVDIPGSEDQLMSSILIVLIPEMPESRGEELDSKDDWREDVGL